MLGFPPTHTKAVVSALVSAIIAALSALLTALQGEHAGFATVTASQWITVVIAFFIGLGVTGKATSLVPNVPLSPAPQPAEGGTVRPTGTR